MRYLAFVLICSPCILFSQTNKHIDSASIEVVSFSLSFTYHKLIYDSIFTESYRDWRNKESTQDLPAEKKDSILAFLRHFPYKKLKKRYENKMVDDGYSISLTLKINKYKKHIYIHNLYDETVAKLLGFLNSYCLKNKIPFYGPDIF